MSLLSPPAPDFNDPLGLLAACHQRILGFCDLLERHWAVLGRSMAARRRPPE